MTDSMRWNTILLTILVVLGIGSSAEATPGMLGTLPHGRYVCALPGDAGGAAWRELPDASFRIENASTYRTSDGSGIYLMTGKKVVFTRGPMKGVRFERVGNSTLVRLDDDGKRTKVRCTRGGTPVSG
uniref:DUF4988 domain-containing protein n=1 Tax=Parerythrobacter lutipelagi TaxID=1964208 RepID=UPI001F005CA5|nr:DUF4988 domain-containing protein [Parerythrobacter lutipelagi]